MKADTADFIFKQVRIDGIKEVTQVKLLYRASLNGWKSEDFHRFCDLKGPTLSLYRSSKNYLAGGFTSKSWTSPSKEKEVEDSSAMVFALTNDP